MTIDYNYEEPLLLNLTPNTSILIDKIDTPFDFDKLYNLRPCQKTKILHGFDKTEKDVNRYHKSYMNSPSIHKNLNSSYMFSGHDTSSNNDPLPEEFIPFLDYINRDQIVKYNQVTINWYENGRDHIAYHSDCEYNMVPDYDIAMINLDNRDPSDNKYRIFRLKNKDTGDKCDIKCKNGMIIKMMSKCQEEFRHGVPKDDTEYKRISITFRKYIL
jgi:hypothetical protein